MSIEIGENRIESAFLDELSRFLSPKQILLPGNEELNRYHWTTLPVNRAIAAAVKPRTVSEVRSLVLLAGKYQQALYPISTGNNWGYGSALPVTSNNIVVDLGEMNRVVEVNPELAYVVVEPGVTQGTLYNFLQEKNLSVMLDPNGAGPNCSVLGNALERGYGMGRYGDHFAAVCGMEIVLPNGEILNTGFGRYEKARAKYTYKCGVGPYIDGLFTQSNLGIVTKMGVWLQPIPEHIEGCFIQIYDDEKIGALQEGFRTLLLEDTIKTLPNSFCGKRFLTIREQYPWDDMNGKMPLGDQIAKKLQAKYNLAAWQSVFGVYGTKQQVRATKKRIRSVLRGLYDEMKFFSVQHIDFIKRYRRLLQPFTPIPLGEATKSLGVTLGLLHGKPDELSLRSPYWARREGPPSEESGINPARDNCGLLWFAPVIPLEAGAIRDFLNCSSEVLTKYNFDFLPALTTVTSRAVDSSLPILFDKNDSDRSAAALACYDELSSRCADEGFFPYRLGVNSMSKWVVEDEPYWKIIRAIKSSLDPNGIISPGRYGPIG